MSRRVMWLCGFGVAAAAALSASLQTYVSMSTHGHAFGPILLWELACWWFWAAVAPLLVAQGARFADPGRTRRSEWRRTIALGLVLTAAHIGVDAVVIVLVQPFASVERYTLTSALATAAKSEWMFDIIVATIALLIGYGSAASDRAQRLALRESRLEADLARAQLDALRLEIEPHFLFNTLNSIASLIRAESPDRALSMLLGLSDLMRSTLETAGPTTTLGAELAFVQRYIALQRVRFMDRLNVSYAIDPGCEGCEVPTLLLQPLVENAFRHGVARRAGVCTIDISARIDSGQLRIRIRDDGAGLPAGFDLQAGAGVGLRNTQSRLERSYGAAASLAIAPRSGGGTDVDITMPATFAGVQGIQAAG
jgi:two-component system, LytTR family, sensor kinase